VRHWQVAECSNPPYIVSTQYSMSNFSDVIFIDSLQLSANFGADCWGRARAQPMLMSIYAHFPNSYLNVAAKSDEVQDSIHYGDLSDVVTKLFEDPETEFLGARDLIGAVAGVVLPHSVVASVRIVLHVPKYILLAQGCTFDATIPATKGIGDVPVKVSVPSMVLAVVIGVNPPERIAKQRVITDIDFFEQAGTHPPVDYPKIVSDIAKDIEASSYLTLEKFAMQIVRRACFSSEAITSVTVRAQKPNANAYARCSGVEITRDRTSFKSPS